MEMSAIYLISYPCEFLWEHVQTMLGKIIVIVMLRAGPPSPPLNIMDFISYTIFNPHSLIHTTFTLLSEKCQLIAYYETLPRSSGRRSEVSLPDSGIW